MARGEIRKSRGGREGGQIGKGGEGKTAGRDFYCVCRRGGEGGFGPGCGEEEGGQGEKREKGGGNKSVRSVDWFSPFGRAAAFPLTPDLFRTKDLTSYSSCWGRRAEQ